MAQDVQLAQLRAFVTVVRLQSYARAAEELSYSEPGVYLQVKGLEKALGLSLVKRHRKQVLLTAEGEVVVAHAVAMLERANALAQAARGLKRRIVVGSGSNTAVSLIMPIIARYQQQFPGNEVEFHAREAPELVRGVIDATFDVVIGGLGPTFITDDQLRTHRLVIVPWAVDRWTLFGSPALAIQVRNGTLHAKGETIKVFHYPVSAQPQWASGLTRYLQSTLGGPITLVELESLEMVRGALVNGLGLGIVPASATLVYGDDMMTTVQALGQFGDLRLRMVHRRSALLAPVVRQFITFLVTNRPRLRLDPQPFEGLYPLPT